MVCDITSYLREFPEDYCRCAGTNRLVQKQTIPNFK
jgi:hypothetical protein